MQRRFIVSLIFALFILPSWRASATPNDPSERAQQAIDRGLQYLKNQQRADGGWHSDDQPPGITALVLRAFVGEPRYVGAKEEFLQNGFARLIGYQKADGGIYADMLANYNTACAASALATGAGEDPMLKESLGRAVEYLKNTQWADGSVGPKGETVEDHSSAWFGGFGYNRQSRPDLSNSQFSIQALHEAGLKPDDPAFQKTLVFLSRCQNLQKTNDQPWTGNDGGFIYSPANGGDSEADSYTTADGKKLWRSYGSMTYAGLKSMIFAGLTKDDPRVSAAVDWIRQNWTLDENPGMRSSNPEQAQHGLYYYYSVMSKALNAYDEPILTDAEGVKHDWRIELIEKVTSLQKPDGSWSGEKRWMEDNQSLVTAYVVLALQDAREDLKQHPVRE